MMKMHCFRGWKFRHPLGMTKKKNYSIRTAKMGKIGLFSKEMIYAMFLSNIVSLLIGTGLGWVHVFNQLPNTEFEKIVD